MIPAVASSAIPSFPGKSAAPITNTATIGPMMLPKQPASPRANLVNTAFGNFASHDRTLFGGSFLLGQRAQRLERVTLCISSQSPLAAVSARRIVAMPTKRRKRSATSARSATAENAGESR